MSRRDPGEMQQRSSQPRGEIRRGPGVVGDVPAGDCIGAPRQVPAGATQPGWRRRLASAQAGRKRGAMQRSQLGLTEGNGGKGGGSRKLLPGLPRAPWHVGGGWAGRSGSVTT
eukprot:scaffold14022_cov108-Isochrysis_galbana.AAC.12